MIDVSELVWADNTLDSVDVARWESEGGGLGRLATEDSEQNGQALQLLLAAEDEFERFLIVANEQIREFDLSWLAQVSSGLRPTTPGDVYAAGSVLLTSPARARTHWVSARTRAIAAKLWAFHGKEQRLPRGVSSLLYRFLCLTAAVGLFDQIHDERSAILISEYFTTEARLVDLTDLVGGVSQSRASELISLGMDELHQALVRVLPGSDKVYPRDQLRKIKPARERTQPRSRTRSEAARVRWMNPSDRTNRVQKMREKARARFTDPEVRAKQREIFAHARETRWPRLR